MFMDMNFDGNIYGTTIEILENRIEEIKKVLPLSENKNVLIDEKKSHEKAIRLLHYCSVNGIDPDYKVAELPFLDGYGYYSYRIMIDNETDNIQHWKELKEINGQEIELTSGDKLLFR